jgi:hypothetical protein
VFSLYKCVLYQFWLVFQVCSIYQLRSKANRAALRDSLPLFRTVATEYSYVYICMGFHWASCENLHLLQRVGKKIVRRCSSPYAGVCRVLCCMQRCGPAGVQWTQSKPELEWPSLIHTWGEGKTAKWYIRRYNPVLLCTVGCEIMTFRLWK